MNFIIIIIILTIYMEYKTPLLKQYFSLVDEYPGAIILMRVGDFYETYGKIAVLTSKLL